MPLRTDSFHAWFLQATGETPFPYQTAFATADELPNLLDIPTGLGKTACAVLGWLWRRRFAPGTVRERTPRRLVYCLPMRVLVEQTRDAAILWLHRLGRLAGEAALEGLKGEERVNAYKPSWEDPEKIAVSVLMGGEDGGQWDIHPERDAILIGTQDMLLSRALDCGYGMSRYRWPMHFGLLNNDCLWFIDEVQLMGNGLATTTQLQAFSRKLGVFSQRQTVWASATLQPDWLRTVDVDPPLDVSRTLALSPADERAEEVLRRLRAKKAVRRASAAMGQASELARQVLSEHQPGTRSLVVLNTVRRAVEAYACIKRAKPKAELVLLHSRFRPRDREKTIAALLRQPGESGTIAVATQVIEAGVDVSARTLFTELAPWSSLVQRFGRCNRNGEFKEADVYWFDVPTGKETAISPPYDADELPRARSTLEKLKNAAPDGLPSVDIPFSHAHVLRRVDVLELFDTTPDLAGHDLDVSRFIRESSDFDVQVFWRAIPADAQPSQDEPQPDRNELCAAPIADVKELQTSGKLRAWVWDSLEGQWERVRRSTTIYPGLTLMFSIAEGHYSPELGWNLGSTAAVTPVVAAASAPDRNDADYGSETTWVTLADHSDHVVEQATQIAEALDLPDALRGPLLKAARWHDAGKAHPEFQKSMRAGEPQGMPDGVLAKRPGKVRHARPGFRHELASGLLTLEHVRDELVAYLAAAHHGKVRLSLRSLPTEKKPHAEAIRFARGVWDGDVIQAADLGGRITLPETRLDLTLMELGESERYGPSWMARMLALRDRSDLGPFRLALLEALLKAADERASRAEVVMTATGGTQ